MQDFAQLCVLVCQVADALQKKHSVPEAIVYDKFVLPFIENKDASLEFELQSEQHQKDSSFDIQSITIVANLIKKQVVKIEAMVGSAVHPGIAKRKLADDEFRLLVEKLTYDGQVLSVYKERLSSHDVNMYMASKKWAAQRHQCSQQMADAVMSQIHVIQMDTDFMKVADRWRHILDQMKSRGVVKTNDQILALNVLNWISPSLINAPCRKIQLCLNNMILNMGNQQHLTMLLWPQHCNKSSAHALQDQMASKEIELSGCTNFHKLWCLRMLPHGDAREERPRIYPGRFMCHSDHNLHKGPWSKTPLVQNPWTLEVAPVKTKDMVVPEDLSDHAVPTTTDPSTHVSAAEKWSQVGQEAFAEILRGVLTG